MGDSDEEMAVRDDNGDSNRKKSESVNMAPQGSKLTTLGEMQPQ